MEKIFVAVRFRPPPPASSDDSSTSGGDREWRIDDTRISLLHRAAPVPGASFAFDHVFDETATNAWIYGVLVRSLICAAVDGFNGTAFAYGQTSSGKTFTMNGSSDHPGIIPLAVRDVFDPVVKTGKLCIEVTPASKLAFISEELCIGCGICVKKCPFDAIEIINLPKDLEKDTTHRYGPNTFKLHRGRCRCIL